MADARSDAAILTEAKERFRLAADAEATLRKNMLEDKRFAAGDHWSIAPQAKAARLADGRPLHVIDLLGPTIKQVTNQLRRNRPAVKVSPHENGDAKTAEVFQGLIRDIEVQSDADVAYDQAGSDAATMGRGWIRVLTEYATDEADQQVIRVRRVRNPLSIYPDPTAEAIDYSDMRFCFVTQDLPRQEFQRRYKDSAMASLTEFSALGDDERYWAFEDSIRIAEYWYVERTTRTKQLPGGKTRQVEDRKVCAVLMSGLDVLEKYEWAGKYIPLVPVIGEEIDLDGKVDYRGITRRAKDSQFMYNVWRCATTETIALAPKAPFIIEEGQIEGHPEWHEANIKPFSVLVYKGKSVGDKLVGPPQREVAEPPIQAIMQASLAAQNDLRATTGFYGVDETDLPEQSGKAILARQRQGEMGNSDFADGLRRGIRHVGRILVDLIPKIYDVPRVLRIEGLDGKAQSVMVFAGQQNQPQGQPSGVDGVFNLGAGRYDVIVSAGPSFESARQEFVELMGQLYQARPELFQLTGDLFLENLDVPHARQMAERMKKMLPPPLQEQAQQIPPQAQAMIGQMQQQIEAMAQELQKAQSGIAKAEIDAKKDIQIQELKNAATIAVAHINAAAKGVALDAHVLEEAQALGHEAVQNEMDRQHERDLSAQQHAQTVDQQGVQLQHQASEAQADRDMASEQFAQSQNQTA